MLIYAPCPDAEFVPVFGGLTPEQFNLLESYVVAVVPAVRYLKELDERIHPAVQRFTLKLHRDDRERARPAIHEAWNRIRPLPRITAADHELAALLRQLARAREADDLIAAKVMERHLVRSIESLLERLLHQAKVEGVVNLWLDGISAQEVQFAAPYGLGMRGYIYVGRSSDASQWQEPFEAELRSSAHGPGLEDFVARFGNRARLASPTATLGDLAEDCPIDDGTFSVRVGGSVPRTGGELVEWALEFRKR